MTKNSWAPRSFRLVAKRVDVAGKSFVSEVKPPALAVVICRWSRELSSARVMTLGQSSSRDGQTLIQDCRFF